MTKKFLFLRTALALFMVLCSTMGWGQTTGTITITRASFPSGALAYGTDDAWTVTASTGETITGSFDLFSNAGQTTMQTRTNSPIGSYPHNTIALPGNITSIVLTGGGTGTAREWTPYLSSSSLTKSNYSSAGVSQGSQTASSNSASTTWNISASSGYKYFYINMTGGAAYLNSIVITYEVSNPTQSTPPTISATGTPNGTDTFWNSAEISLAGTGNIYYTTDGSTPTVASTAYTAPFTISSSTTVKAIAKEGSLTESTVAEKTFNITYPATASVPYTQPFNNTLGDWINYKESGNAGYSGWTTSAAGATSNGYNQGAAIGWLISPQFTLPAGGGLLSFNHHSQFTSTDPLLVRYSTNYLGYGDPTAATWQTASSINSVANGTTTDINIPVTGNVHIALVYNDVSTPWASWVVSNLTLDLPSITPAFVINPTSITGLNYGFGSGPSVAQNFTLEGANLDNSNVTITAPANFEISQSETTGYASSIILNAYDGASQTLWVRLAAGLASASYTGDISINGGGVVTALTLPVSGDVLAQPTVTASSQTGTVGVVYNYQIIATENPTSYTLASGSLPAGLSLNTTTGEISGTPTAAGTFTANITATNAAGTSAPAAIDFTIAKGTQTVTLNDLNVNVGGTDIALPVDTNEGITINYVSSDAAVASVTGNVLSIGTAGTATITASNAGDTNYLPHNTTFSVNVIQPYNGSGTFVKITSLADLTEGYYVITNETGAFLMTNTNNDGYFESAAVTPVSDEIINPSTDRVWSINTNGAGKTIYNEVSQKYVGWTTGNSASAVDAPTDNSRWTFTYADDKFTVNNVATPVRQLSYNSGAPRFAAYGNTNQHELQMYKLIIPTTWNGTTWDNGAPAAGSAAVIDGVYSTDATHPSITAETITITQNGVLQINSGDSVTATTVTVNDGGNFIEQDGAAANITNFTLNKTATSAADRYVFWSSPVAGQNVYDIYPALTPQFVMTYNSDTDLYPVVADPTTAGLGVGYSVKVPAGATEAVFSGTPNTGNIAVALDAVANANGNTWNLIGNPYPSNLNLVQLYNAGNNGIDSSIYLWNNLSTGNTQQASSVTDWTIFNASGTGTWQQVTNGLVGTGESVKPGQGFLVKATAPLVTFTNNMRNADDATFLNKAQSSAEGKFWLQLTTPAGQELQTAVTYGEGALNTYEAFDSKMMNVGANGLYTFADNHKLGIQGRDYFVNTDVVTVGNKHAAAGQYTISLAGTTGLFAAGQAIYLKDKQTATYTNLQTDDYVFTADALEQQNRFEVVYMPQGALGTVEVAKGETVVYKDGEHFTVKSEDKILSIEVFDASGRLIGTEKPNRTTATIIVDAKGMYVLKIKTTHTEVTKKIMK